VMSRASLHTHTLSRKTADLFANVFVCCGLELFVVCRYFCSTKLHNMLSLCLYFMTIQVVNDHVINFDAVRHFVVMIRVMYNVHHNAGVHLC